MVVARCRLAAEKDASERDSRDKETRLLSLSRQLDELRDRLAESERLRVQQQRELDDLTSSQDDAGKNVSDAMILNIHNVTYQCLDAVGWATGRASGL